jgi:magnesium transporter
MPTFHLQHNRVTWTNIVNPTPQDVEALRQAHPYIHPLNLEDLTSVLERPKIDEQDNYLFIVMHFPLWDPVKRLSVATEVEFILGRQFLVTIHDGKLKPLMRLFNACQADNSEAQRWLGKGANDAFYYIVDQLVDYIFPILRKVDANINSIQERIFTEDTRTIIRDIGFVRRDVIALRRLIRQQVPIIEFLENTEHPVIREELDEYFGDIVDHLHRARDIIDEDAEIIAGLSDTANIVVNHRLNEVIRILTVISVIILPMTLVSSIYGMNVNLPLDEHPLAFIIVNGVMLIVAIFMLIYFRRRRWL